MIYIEQLISTYLIKGPKQEYSELNESDEETTPRIKINTPTNSNVEPVNNGNVQFYSRRIVCINGECEITVCVNGKCKKETKNTNKNK